MHVCFSTKCFNYNGTFYNVSLVKGKKRSTCLTKLMNIKEFVLIINQNLIYLQQSEMQVQQPRALYQRIHAFMSQHCVDHSQILQMKMDPWSIACSFRCHVCKLVKNTYIHHCPYFTLIIQYGSTV